MSNPFDIPKNDIFPITNLNEPEVWIEYLRVDNGIYISGVNMIIPPNVKVRCRGIVNSDVQVWEYLM